MNYIKIYKVNIYNINQTDSERKQSIDNNNNISNQNFNSNNKSKKDNYNLYYCLFNCCDDCNINNIIHIKTMKKKR